MSPKELSPTTTIRRPHQDGSHPTHRFLLDFKSAQYNRRFTSDAFLSKTLYVSILNGRRGQWSHVIIAIEGTPTKGELIFFDDGRIIDGIFQDQAKFIKGPISELEYQRHLKVQRLFKTWLRTVYPECDDFEEDNADITFGKQFVEIPFFSLPV